MEAYSQTLAYMNEVKINDRVKINYMKTVRSRCQSRTDKSWFKQNVLWRKGLSKEKGFEFRVKLVRGL